jgi:hypothetical protein
MQALRIIHLFSNTKIGDFYACGSNDQIGRFDVTMDNFLGVGVVERAGCLFNQGDHLLERQTGFLLEQDG